MVAHEEACKFLEGVLGQKGAQRDFSLHCVLVALTTSKTKATSALSENLKNSMS